MVAKVLLDQRGLDVAVIDDYAKLAAPGKAVIWTDYSGLNFELSFQSTRTLFIGTGESRQAIKTVRSVPFKIDDDFKFRVWAQFNQADMDPEELFFAEADTNYLDHKEAAEGEPESSASKLILQAADKALAFLVEQDK